MGCGGSKAEDAPATAVDVDASVSQNPSLAASSALGISAKSVAPVSAAAGTGASAPAALDAAAREALQEAALAAAAAGGTTLELSQPESSRSSGGPRLPLLSAVPSAVWGMIHLTVLDLSGQSLSVLAPQLGACGAVARPAARACPTESAHALSRPLARPPDRLRRRPQATSPR